MRALAFCAALLATGPATAFELPVHERITREAYRKADVNLGSDVIAGVRWNDLPPAFKLGAFLGACNSPGTTLEEGLQCWTSSVRLDRWMMEVLSRPGSSIVPMRSHFGDLQFLHAMAAAPGEPAAQTREKVLRWSELAWRVARGEIPAKARVHELRDHPRSLEPKTAAWLGELFAAPEKRLWTVHDVFMPWPGDVRAIAFGSLLHVVEDSYSAAHVRRLAARVQPNGCPSYDASDPVLEFHTYADQDAAKHGVCDSVPDWLASARPGSPLDVVAEVVRAYDEGRDWPHVKAILEGTVFRLQGPAAAARAGACFELREDPNLAPIGGAALASLEAGCLEAKR